MAVLNVTPDSFFDGGILCDRNNQANISLALGKVDSYLKSGASIIDVGGESTRPGAEPVGVDEELDRVVSVVEAIVERFGVFVSVDTSSPLVITESANVGAVMINDVRALTRKGAVEAVVMADLSVVLMHMNGEPTSMQLAPSYKDEVDEVKSFLLERAGVCETAGIKKQKIFIDPGFGFGKTLEHNLQLFRSLNKLSELGFPLVVGVSRKSMIGEILDKPLDERLFGSIALAMLAVQRGANIIRVHDVAATADVLRVLNAVKEEI
jgi:dihydropteroate synthase|tara:strand:- start:2631 stop:3428 length:798 start_codon:yes stop_codon:yes gene_type:complete